MIIFFLLAVGNVDGQQMEGYKYSPNYYNCVYIAKSADITIDGDLSEKAWEKADWSSLFVDIENSARPAPYLDTRVKMLWDDAYLYIAAEIMESHLWATYSKQDMEISQENSFQVFIDPEGNTHNYLEIQINTLGAVLGVFHTKPFRDSGLAINSFDFKGLKRGVRIFGTLNNPSDRDEKWTIELAIPWNEMAEKAILKGPPKDKDSWKINFLRVQWDRDIKNGKYVKQKEPQKDTEKPANNWAWSQQGSLTMHQPETWGIIVFNKKADKKQISTVVDQDILKWELRKVYYQERSFYEKYGIYTSNVQTDLSKAELEIKVLGDSYTAKYCKGRACYYIREDGRIWESKK